MKVKQLIKALQKMPQNLEVGYAHGDNLEYEVAGWCESLMLLDMSEHDRETMGRDGQSMFDSMPNKCVVIRG